MRRERKESYQPRVFSASDHVEAGLALFGVGHTERQTGQLHWGGRRGQKRKYRRKENVRQADVRDSELRLIELPV